MEAAARAPPVAVPTVPPVVAAVRDKATETVETVKAIFNLKDDGAPSTARQWSVTALSESMRQYAMELLRESLGADAAMGAAGIIVANVALKAIAWTVDAVSAFAVRRLTVTATFESGDPAHDWILNWLSLHPYAETATDVLVSSRLRRGEGLNPSTRSTAVDYTPAPGSHFLRVGCRWALVSRSRRKVAGGGNNTTDDAISVTMLGRSRAPIDALVREALDRQIARDKHLTVIYTGDQYGSWVRSRVRPLRPLSSVIMQGTLAADIEADLHEFFSSEEWYLERGIPFRRGYLFYGPPGNGKTSLVAALAGSMGVNIHALSLANPSLTDETMMDLMNGLPHRCILLMEDVDHAFARRTDADDGEGSTVLASSKITFAGLLNAMDGVAAQEGRLLILTTNHPERLSPILIRPGRVDVRVHIGNASASQMRRMCERFYGNVPGVDVAALAEEFVAGLPASSEENARLLYGEQAGDGPGSVFGVSDSGGISMARLQGHFMKYKRDPRAAVAHKWELVGAAPGEARDQGTIDLSQ